MTTFGAAGTRISASSGTSATPALPAGVQAGYLLIAVVAAKNNITHAWPAGWTKGDQQNSGASFTASWGWRVATGTDSAPAVTWTGSVANCAQTWSLIGVNRITAIGVQGHNAGTTTPHTITGIATSGPNSNVIYIDVTSANTSLTQPTGWSRDIDNGSATGTTHNSTGMEIVGSGSAGSISVVGAAAVWVMWQIEIMPVSTFPARVRPTNPLLNQYHPSAKRLIQCYITSSTSASAQRELVSNKLLTTQPSSSGNYTFVNDSASRGNVLKLSGVASLVAPYSNMWKNTTTGAYTSLFRSQIQVMTTTGDGLRLADNSGGDGAHLHNGSGTTLYSFVFGNQSSNLIPLLGQWENYVVRWVSGGNVEIWSFSDSGVKDTGRGGSTAAATTGSMSFASTAQTIFATTISCTALFDFYCAWGRFVPDDEMSWFLRNR